jgi:hypothetical protein
MKSYLIKLVYMIVGWFMLLPLVAYCKHKGLSKLPQWAFTWDNEEDGYDGDKTGWYSRYLGKPVSIWNAYIWCAWRNPCWNIRYHRHASISVKVADVMLQYRGNARHHTYVKGYRWYDTVINDKYKSHFRLIPITATKSLYVRWGWKIYPHYYSPEWLGKEVPKYKERSVWTITVRIRGQE